MNTTKNIGLIECGAPVELYQMNGANLANTYNVKKVLMADKASTNNIQLKYPQVEIVEDKSSIILDKTIDLVIVSSKATDMNLIAEVLQAGKQVQIL